MLAVGCAVALAFLGGFALSRKAPKPKHNVIIIIIDTLRQDALSCHNSERPTPNIDAFAAKSAQFMEAYCTIPLTLPSHLSLFTGLYPQRTGIYRNARSINDNVNTLAEILKERGYYTSAIVSSFTVAASWGLAQGFRTYHESDEAFISPAETTKTVLAELESIASPFFLWIHYHDPHNPYTPDDRVYAQGTIDSTNDVLMNILAQMQGIDEEITYTDEDVRLLRDLYDDEVRLMDKEIGFLLSVLEEKGFFDDSIIVLTSDHGEAFGEHGTMSHQWGLWPENILVPLLYYYPGVSPNRIYYPVSLVDVMPTILESLGITIRNIDGQNLFDTSKPRRIQIEHGNFSGEKWETRFPRMTITKEILHPKTYKREPLSESDIEKLKALGYMQ